MVDPQNLQPAPTPCPVSPTALTLGGNLAAFTVEVRCTRTLETEGTETVAVYQVTSTAASGVAGELDYVERQHQASFSK